MRLGCVIGVLFPGGLMAIGVNVAVSPRAAEVGQPLLAFYLSVAGTSFAPTAVVSWNGAPRQTAYLNATTLAVTLLASDISQPSTTTPKLTVVGDLLGWANSNGTAIWTEVSHKRLLN